MADVPARTELAVTTGPIRGSHKIYVEGRDGIRIAAGSLLLAPEHALPQFPRSLACLSFGGSPLPCSCPAW